MKRAKPRAVLSRSRVEWILYALIVASGLLLVHDAVRAHAPASWREHSLLRSEWIGVAFAAGSFASAVSALIARRQWAFSHAPLLRYTSGYRSESKLGLDKSHGRIWCVDVSNSGRGVAIITDIAYDVEIVEPPMSLTNVDFLEMLGAVQRTGFADEQDFVLDNWSVGTSVRNGEDRRLWELPDPVRAKVRRLVAHMTYASELGERFETDVSAIPRR
jgi:hypothetical protein